QSDMEGSKGQHLDAWARRTGRSLLRFDYSGHGQSSGRFEDGCIGDWAEDTAAILDACTEGPLVLVGSSMGGWQALLAARARPERCAGLVGIAAAPDFTEDGMWASFTDAQRTEMATKGRISVPSDFAAPQIITQRLIEDGRSHFILRSPLALPMPVRLLHGTADDIVPVSVATTLLDHANAPDMRLTLVKDGDHRLSTPANLALLVATVEEVLTVVSAVPIQVDA
ncbi:MAG: alpha/beta fold hydrolase, partial [Pseudomonadota bacterium]